MLRNAGKFEHTTRLHISEDFKLLYHRREILTHMTVLVCHVTFLPKVHIAPCAISHRHEVEEHVSVAVRVWSLIVKHFDVLLHSQFCIHFSSQLCMLHVFVAHPPGFYLSDNIVNSKSMRSFTTGFSDLCYVCTSGSKNVSVSTMQVEPGLECGLEDQGMLVRLPQG
jgi:hypothetical protein